jgi:radical SAM-linked protein
MRIRIIFKKNQAMRFTGHLDLQQTWMRVFRRASLPLEHSQGFHPQPKIQLASALPLSYVSSAEVLDAWLKDDCSSIDLAMKIQEALPPGLEVISVEEIPLDAPKIQIALQTADYQVYLPANESAPDLKSKIDEFLQASEILVERRGKPRNIRELVESLVFTYSVDGKPAISMRLSARESATGRADEVISVLGVDPHKCLFERTSLNFSKA